MRNVASLTNDIENLKKDAYRTMSDIGKIVTEASVETKENSEKLLTAAYDELQKDFKLLQEKFEALSADAQESVKRVGEHVKGNPYPYLLIGLVGAFFLGRGTK